MGLVNFGNCDGHFAIFATFGNKFASIKESFKFFTYSSTNDFAECIMIGFYITWDTSPPLKKRVVGIGPTLLDWKSKIMPLYDTRSLSKIFSIEPFI